MLRKIIQIVFLFVSWLTLISTGYCQSNQNTYLLLTAMKVEADPVLQKLSNLKQIKINRVPCFMGEYNGKKIILASMGVGDINAAIVTSNLISAIYPKAVILSGTSGALQPYLKIGDIILAAKAYNIAHIDNGFRNQTISSPINHLVVPLFLTSSQSLLLKAEKIKFQGKNFTKSAKKYKGLVVSVNQFPPNIRSLKKMQLKGALADDMESYAFLQVCWLYNANCLVVRSISDHALKTSSAYYHVDGKKKYERSVKLAANNAANFSLELISSL